MKATNKTMAGARFASGTKLSGAELPDCFAAATLASAAKCSYKRRQADDDDKARLARKAKKLGWVKELIAAQAEADTLYTQTDLDDRASHGPRRAS